MSLNNKKSVIQRILIVISFILLFACIFIIFGIIIPYFKVINGSTLVNSMSGIVERFFNNNYYPSVDQLSGLRIIVKFCIAGIIVSIAYLVFYLFKHIIKKKRI